MTRLIAGLAKEKHHFTVPPPGPIFSLQAVNLRERAPGRFFLPVLPAYIKEKKQTAQVGRM